MKARKMIALLLAASVVFSNAAPAALAAEDHIHDETCGYSDGLCIYEADGALILEDAQEASYDSAGGGIGG